MRITLSPLLLAAALLTLPTRAQTIKPQAVESSKCHVHVGYEFIWTFEVVNGTPVVNVITFTEGEWMLRPEQIVVGGTDPRRRGARIRRFSIDTGVQGDPFNITFLRVHGNSFFGFDLLGDFSKYQEPAHVAVDLGNYRYELQPVDCLDFEMLVAKISQVNFNSPDVRDDYRVLGIMLIGRRSPRPRR